MNILENEKFRALLLLLREDLQDSDIPHHNFLRSRIMSNWKVLTANLRDEMEVRDCRHVDINLTLIFDITKNSAGRISLTMDVWSDQNLVPFMGVTAHRIVVTEVNTAAGPRTLLKLCSYLIGFSRIPGRHTGDHLAQLLIYILDRLNITHRVSGLVLKPKLYSDMFKIGWITLDNASNNDTCVNFLGTELLIRGNEDFNPSERRLRYVSFFFLNFINSSLFVH